jgi:hypothetical protein
MRSPGRAVGATVLCCEALVVLFAGLVAKDVSRLGQGQALGLAGGLALALVLTAGLLGRPFGRLLGSAIQAAVVAAGIWVPVMFVIGPIFVLLWVAALRLETRFGGPPSAGRTTTR